MSRIPVPDDGWTAEAIARGAVAVVDLAAIRHNVMRSRSAAPAAEVMAVVKADAYGHGLVPCARAAREAGATWLGAALPSEAMALRDAGIDGRVLTWLAGPGADWSGCLRRDIDVSVSSTQVLAEVVAAARVLGLRARVHLKADTGLSRSGAQPADWKPLVAAAAAAQQVGALDVVGVWSHFAYADDPGNDTISTQLARFHVAVTEVLAAGLKPEVRHIANSAATFTLPDAHLDLVRPGIAIYGISPGGRVPSAGDLGLRPAMTLKARFALVKNVPAGEGVSYAHAYVTERDTVLGLVPLGYADGIARSAQNRGPLQAGGHRLTVAGRVCMDQLVVDLGDTHGTSTCVAGDEVIVFGPGDTGPTAEDWASVTGTIAYEIVTRIGPRVPRVHVRDTP